jgi:hypothetical protein
MFGIGGPELAILGILAVLILGGRLPLTIRALQESAKYFADGLRDRLGHGDQPPRIDTIDLIIESRDPTMKDRFKKFLWTPAFWATLGIIGCTTGWYFQGVAANGTGLWCLGLMFLGAAYIEHND